MRNTVISGALALVLVTTLAGCFPVVTRKWDVQPVHGHVFDAESGQPVAGARVVNANRPELSAISAEDGTFMIEGESALRLHLLMAGTFADRQIWHVHHDDYAAGVTVTHTLAPALDAQPTSPSIPMFRELDNSPAGCRFGPYLLRLYELMQAVDRPPDPYFIPCDDPAFREILSQAYVASMQ